MISYYAAYKQREIEVFAENAEDAHRKACLQLKVAKADERKVQVGISDPLTHWTPETA